MHSQEAKNIQMIVGSQIKQRRTSASITQEVLAARCGIFRTYLSRIEGGVANPTITVIEALAKALSVEPWELLREIPPPAAG